MENNGSVVPAPQGGARRSTIESGRVATLTSVSGGDRGEPMPLLKAIGARPLGRSAALWIIAGALWISLGMIVSATLVTVAFLT